MAHDIQVTVDSVDPHSLADWWCDALGWEAEPSDEAFIRDMVAAGHAREEDTTTHRGVLVWRAGAALRRPDGLGPRLLFQGVEEVKSGKNRVHLDVRVPAGQRDAEVERLLATGATRLHEGRQGPHTWVTLTDPEGNELCVSE